MPGEEPTGDRRDRSGPTADRRRSGHDPSAVPPRFAHLDVDDRATVIYDREAVRAWIQSTHAVSLPAREPT